MKTIQFNFSDGYYEVIDINNPNINPCYYRMYGVLSHQERSNDPQSWMDDFNDWDEEEGNVNRIHGDCVSWEAITK